MFPETMDDNMDIPQTQIDPSNPTAVQRLAEPSQMLKTNILDLLNYQNEAELAKCAIPELIRLLNTGDPHILQQASIVVNQISKKEAGCHALMNDMQLVAVLVRVANSSNDPDTVKNGVGALHNMSHHRLGFYFCMKFFSSKSHFNLYNYHV